MTPDFEQTIKDNIGILHKLCRVYTNNPDEYAEMFQDMLVQIWRSTRNFRGDAKVSTWVYQVCINTALSFRAKIGRERLRFEPLEGKIFLQGPPELLEDERLRLLYDAIRQLKSVDRAIVTLYLEERSHEEIGNILGISKTNVGTRLMRVKRELIERLAENE